MRQIKKAHEHKIICFDFDGTCTQEDIFPDTAKGNVNEEVRDAITYLYYNGYQVVINSCRPSYLYLDVKSWLDENDFKYTHIQLMSKPVADLYIDDKGLFPKGRLLDFILAYFNPDTFIDMVCSGKYESKIVHNIHNVPENPAASTKTGSKRHVIALPITGGLDSSTIWKILENAGYDYIPFYVDFGQEYKQQELDTIKNISVELFDRLNIIDLSNVDYAIYKHILTGRNFAVVLSIANWLHEHNMWGEIWFGNLLGETPSINGDKSSRFFNDIQLLLSDLNLDVRLVNPLIGMTKFDLIRYWESNNSLRYLDTRSCFSAAEGECGECQSCFRKWVAVKSVTGVDISPSMKNPTFEPHIKKYIPLMTEALSTNNFTKYSKNRCQETLKVIQ